MNKILFPLLLIITFALLFSCAEKPSNEDDGTPPPSNPILIDSVYVNGKHVASNATVSDLPLTPINIRIVFSTAIDTAFISKERILFSGKLGKEYTAADEADNQNVLLLTTNAALESGAYYEFRINKGANLGDTITNSFTCKLYAQYSNEPVFPVIDDEELLTLVQHKTFNYFWDFGHPASGLARERSSSGDVVTSGGSGFGLMALLVGIERGFITRQEGLDRLTKIVDFLIRPETETFHGAFPHWLNGSTGKTIPFSTDDNGGDLVETAYLMQGLLAVQEYFKNGTSQQETNLRNNIQTLWENVEWDWYRQGGQNVLYWHWSANKGWKMNMRISGWNECLIVYVLAASSPTHAIPKEVYDEGWARNGNMRNGRPYYNITLPLGSNGDPLFFSHYSFLGLDPHKISDQYANYWEQTVAHARINYEYCVANPKKQMGYSAQCWGLTASDIPNGYTASSPTNDVGVIAPTAALSSFPYTPDESMEALKYFYYTLGKKIWTDNYGFKDAFCLSKNWVAADHLAIDQGPIVVMIENYRSAMIWNLFMQNADIRRGLTVLNFQVD